MAWLHMVDRLTFRVTETDPKKRRLFECKDAQSETGKSLLVRMAASHSGIVNGNMRFYRPDRMAQGAHTFLPKDDEDAHRPVLLGHDKKGDVLGRILESKYVDEGHLWVPEFPTLKDTLFYAPAGKKHYGLFDSVDWITEHLADVDGYHGLGHLELGTKITNPAAIQKVMRDEYLNVSIGFNTDAAICSVCHTDWASDDRCEHELGELVDGKRMFLITGNFQFKECSFVNFPADRWARVIGKKEFSDSLERILAIGIPLAERAAYAVQMSDARILEADIEPVHEGDMQSTIDIAKIDLNAWAEEIKKPELTAERALEMRTTLKQVKADQLASEDEQKLHRRLLSNLNAKIKKNGWKEAATDAKPEEKKAIQTEIEAVISGTTEGADQEKPAEETAAAPDAAEDKDCENGACEFVPEWQPTDEEDKTFFARSEEEIYADLASELDAMKAEGLLTDEQLADAKLSSEQRKKLKGSTFCGPNRSFPVPDCKHVTAARRLIGRAKLSADSKKKVLACVSRKAAKLGCGGKDGLCELGSPETVIAKVTKDLKDSDDTKSFVTALDGLHTAYMGVEEDSRYHCRSAVGALMETWYAASSLEYWKTQLAKDSEDVLLPKAEVKTMTDELAEAGEAIEKYEGEIDGLKVDVATAEKQNEAMLLKVKDAMATMLVAASVLSGKKGFTGLTADQVRGKIKERAARSVASLNDAVADLLSELDGFEPAPAASGTKSDETGAREVSDNAQLTKTSLPGEDSATVTSPETKAEQPMVRFPGESQEAFQRRLAQKRFQSVSTKSEQ